MSPRPLPPGRGGPSPRSRWTVPCCVPAGRRIFLVPLRVGTSTVAPWIASEIVIGIVTSRLPSSRWTKTGRRRHPRDHVQVSRRSAAGTVLALAGDPDPAAVPDSRRDLHPVALLLEGQPRPAAGLARVLDDLAAAPTLRARPADGEEALALGVHAGSAAARAGDRRGPGLCARAVTRLARGLLRHDDGDLGPVHRLFEREVDLGLEVPPASLDRLGPAPAPEEGGEDVAEVRREAAATGAAGDRRARRRSRRTCRRRRTAAASRGRTACRRPPAPP